MSEHGDHSAAGLAAMTLAEKNKQLVSGVEQGLLVRADRLAAMLPPHYSTEKFIAQAVMIVSRNPDLLECTQSSIVVGVLEAAEIGLDLAPGLQQCCLVGRKDKNTGKKIAQFQLMTRGLITLIVGSGGARAITAQVVRKGDKFDFDEGAQTLSHVRGESEADDDITHVYARAVLPSGDVIYEVMTAAKVERIRARAATDYVWKNNKAEMYRKTAVRAIIKYLPIPVSSPIAAKLARAVDNDNVLFENEPEPASAPEPIKQPTRKSDRPTAPVDAESTPIEPQADTQGE